MQAGDICQRSRPWSCARWAGRVHHAVGELQDDPATELIATAVKLESHGLPPRLVVAVPHVQFKPGVEVRVRCKTTSGIGEKPFVPNVSLVDGITAVGVGDAKDTGVLLQADDDGVVFVVMRNENDFAMEFDEGEPLLEVLMVDPVDPNDVT